MSKTTNAEILVIASSELSIASTGTGNSFPALEDSLNYYLGNPNGLETEGNSKVTSTDVADAIEWIMPQIMKSFTQNNDIVTFDPVHEGDDKQAEMESQYTYDVLMKQNKGFILIHQMVKDALIQRNGVLKVFYSADEKVWTEQYTGITEQELNVLGSDEHIEILELTQAEDPLSPEYMISDVTVKITEDAGRIQIISVPLEEFRLNDGHNSICLDDARFTAHIVQKTISELLEEGYTQSLLEGLPASSTFLDSEYRFSAQGETAQDDDSIDPSQRLIEIAECYMMIDLAGKGIAEYAKVTLAGGDSPTHVLSVEPVNSSPWISTTAILMSHKFQGLSIYDRLKEIQDQKTALWRNTFDNLYLQNNQRFAVVDNQVNIDDMLVSRPGGIVRVKRLDAIMPLTTPQVSSDSQNMMRYLDEVGAGRSGVSAEGGAAPQNIGDRVGSEGVERMMSAKEELVGLIIRVIAETGIKPLMLKIRDLATSHQDAITDYKFRSDWIKIQPGQWVERTNCTVRVGTGTGDHDRQQQALTFIMQLQEKIQMMPTQIMVDQPQMFAAVDDYARFAGLNGASKYFLDPMSKEGQDKQKQKSEQASQQSQQDQQMQQSLAASQMKLAEAEEQKAKAQFASVQAKAQADMAKNQLQSQKQNYEAEIKGLETQLKEAELITNSTSKSAELQFKYDDMQNRTALEMSRIEADKEKQINDDFNSNKETVSE